MSVSEIELFMLPSRQSIGGMASYNDWGRTVHAVHENEFELDVFAALEAGPLTDSSSATDTPTEDTSISQRSSADLADRDIILAGTYVALAAAKVTRWPSFEDSVIRCKRNGSLSGIEARLPAKSPGAGDCSVFGVCVLSDSERNVGDWVHLER